MLDPVTFEVKLAVENAHATTIWNVEISNDGKYAISSAFNKTFLLWDVYNSVLLERMQGHQDVTLSVSISPDNHWIASGSEKLIYLLKGHRDMVMEMAFSPDGCYLENEEAILDLVYHPDGKSIYSISFSGDLTRWEVHPEIFVLKYYDKPYRDELTSDPIFEPRRKGESKKDFLLREQEAALKKATIVKPAFKAP